jgi:hypothetical protein
MARKKGNQLLYFGIAAAALAAVYFMTNKKPFTASVPGTVPSGAGVPNYLQPEGSAVSDIVSSLADSNLPLQFAPADMQTLKPLDLDIQTPGQIEEAGSENYDA